MSLGKNLLNLRKRNNLSQEELAEKLNVTRQTISNWELDETEPTPKQLKVLSKLFNISIDDLLDNDIEIEKDKASSTEKLASIIIKVLKIIGIIFIVILVIDVVSLILFGALRTGVKTSFVEEVTLNCNINENKYLITVGSDSTFECNNCSKDIKSEIKRLIDYSNINETEDNISKYFSDNNGICE